LLTPNIEVELALHLLLLFPKSNGRTGSKNYTFCYEERKCCF
jgi:hypothetical protein